MAKYTAENLSQLLDGDLEGDGSVKITGVSPIEDGEKGTVCFLTQSRYISFASQTGASVLVTGHKTKLPDEAPSTIIRVQHPYAAFARVMNLFYDTTPKKSGVSDQAQIADSATLGEDVYIDSEVYISENVEIGDNVQIYPQVYIGDNVTIADNTVIYSGAQIYRDCSIGNDCIIHAGVVIGSDGFGYAPDEQGVFHKIPQIGKVRIDDGVEIGANSTIDRGTLGATVIGKGVKLDNLVQVAHNVRIGENTVVAAQTGISGSTEIGKHCMIGGQVGFVGHISIADGTKVNAKSGVSKSVKQKHSAINGIPAFNYRDSLKSRALFRKLPDLEEKLRHLEAKVKEFVNSSNNE